MNSNLSTKSFKSSAKTYSVKVTFKDETRRLQLSEQQGLSFLSLKKALGDLIPALHGCDFTIQWQDDEVISNHSFEIESF